MKLSMSLISRGVLIAFLLVTLVGPVGIARAQDLGDHGIRLYDGENYTNPGPKLTLQPGTEVFFAAHPALKNWFKKISSIKLGKKVGVLLHGDWHYSAYVSDQPKLGRMNNEAYLLVAFDKTTGSMPDGARFAKYHDSYGTGTSLTRYEWFITAGKTPKLQANKWPGNLLGKNDLRYLKIFGPNTTVKVRSKSGFEKEYNFQQANQGEPDLEGAIGLDKIAYFEVLTSSEGNRTGGPVSSGGPGSIPGVSVGIAGSPSTNNLGGLWHTDLGDFQAKHTDSDFSGELTFSGNANAKGYVFGKVEQRTVKFHWFVHPFEFGTGELTVASDFKSMEGTYTSKIDEQDIKKWKLWR